MSEKRIAGWMVALALLALVIGGCTGAGGQPKLNSITYNLTGGIAGFDQSLAIGSDGSFTVTNRGQQVSAGKLSANEQQAVRTQVAAVPWSQLAAKYVDPRVADAMFEAVATKVSDHDYKVEVGTGGTPPAELRTLLDTMREILRNHLAG